MYKDVILQGDVLEQLEKLPDESVDMVLTSPPYWGLRDYGVQGQIGLEESFDAFLERLVMVFRSVRRVLKKEGTLWINMGDSYVDSGKGQTADGNADPKRKKVNGMRVPRSGYHDGRKNRAERLRSGSVENLKRKDLIGQPWRLAFALQADGWYLRQDIIWHKPNPMPESAKDRCTKSHEYLFLLSKSPTYHYDYEAVMETCSPSTNARVSQNVQAQLGSKRAYAGNRHNGPMKACVGKQPSPSGWDKGSGAHGSYHRAGREKTVTYNGMNKNNSSFDEALRMPVLKRNKRSVWTIPTKPYKEAHFATYPEELCEVPILAGCPIGGTVLDIFFGSGTTGLVARKHDRHFIGIELNPSYVSIAQKRLEGWIQQKTILESTTGGKKK